MEGADGMDDVDRVDGGPDDSGRSAPHIETVAVHAANEPDAASGAIAQPITLSSTFERGADGGYPHGFMYSRFANPNRSALESATARLEGGVVAAAFGSGLAATHAVFQCLNPGDHAVVTRGAYFGAQQLLKKLVAPAGIAVDFVDTSDLAALRAALRKNTRLVWIETPSNPLLAITDIAAAAAIAHDAGAVVGCDNTLATPVLTRPLALGADLVVHSASKYLAGHSDVVGGIVVGREEGELFARLRTVQTLGGAVPSPFDCWLTLRGIRTLPLRIREQSRGAARLALYLAEHPRVSAVHYPGLAAHAGHAVAARQMEMPGAMLSFETRGTRDDAMAVAARTRLFAVATSLGGIESFIEHRASQEGPESTTPPTLLRISVGIEHPDDLIADLSHALA